MMGVGPAESGDSNFGDRQERAVEALNELGQENLCGSSRPTLVLGAIETDSDVAPVPQHRFVEQQAKLPDILARRHEPILLATQLEVRRSRLRCALPSAIHGARHLCVRPA